MIKMTSYCGRVFVFNKPTDRFRHITTKKSLIKEKYRTDDMPEDISAWIVDEKYIIKEVVKL